MIAEDENMADKTIAEIITEDAAKNASMSIDGISKTKHSLPDLIAADEYLKKATAAGSHNASTGIRLGVFRGPEHF